jgi:hypothetical protein
VGWTSPPSWATVVEDDQDPVADPPPQSPGESVDGIGGPMARRSPEELQDRRDIRRAQVLLGLSRGISSAESAGVLQHRAAVERISLHAAALEVLAAGPTDDLVFTRPDPTSRHLSVVPTSPAPRSAVAEASEIPDDEQWQRR